MSLPQVQRRAHIRRVKRVICLGCLLWIGCGGEVPPPVAPPLASPPAAPAAPPPGALWREEVVKTVDAGLGRFLQHVEVEPKLDAGVFVGFRIVSLQPADYWQGVDLEPGDVVLRVNSLPIERDSEAYAVFQTLKSAKQLTVLLVRDGEERELTLKIVSRGGSSPQKRSAVAKEQTKARSGAAVAASAAAAPEPGRRAPQVPSP